MASSNSSRVNSPPIAIIFTVCGRAAGATASASSIADHDENARAIDEPEGQSLGDGCSNRQASYARYDGKRPISRPSNRWRNCGMKMEMPPVALWYRGRRDYGRFMDRVFALRGPGWQPEAEEA